MSCSYLRNYYNTEKKVEVIIISLPGEWLFYTVLMKYSGEEQCQKSFKVELCNVTMNCAAYATKLSMQSWLARMKVCHIYGKAHRLTS